MELERMDVIYKPRSGELRLRWTVHGGLFWRFHKNKIRTNVMRATQIFVYSDTLGDQRRNNAAKARMKVAHSSLATSYRHRYVWLEEHKV